MNCSLLKDEPPAFFLPSDKTVGGIIQFGTICLIKYFVVSLVHYDLNF